MPNFTAGTSFTDGVTNDVTALKLNALVADAVPTSSLALTSTNGTIANFTSSTANITLGTIPTLTAGTTTGTAGIFTSGTVTTLNSTTGTITNLSTTLAGDLTISQGTATLSTTGATAATYGTTSAIPRITVDAKGRVTAASTVNAPVGFRNRIINGDMQIDQRNAGASVTAVNNTYCLDRWQIYSGAASKFSVQQVTDAPAGFGFSLKATSLSAYSVGASESFNINQFIEGFNTVDLSFGTASAKSITISFWVKSSLTGTFGGVINNASYGRSYPFTYSILSANTWEQKSVTIAGDTSGTWVGATNGIGVIVGFGLGNGASVSGTAGAWNSNLNTSATGAVSVVGTNGATFYITGVQFEVGSNATEFERRPYGTELALCQRYFETTQNIGAAVGSINTAGNWQSVALNTSDYYDFGKAFFKVTKRTNPTVTPYSTRTGASGKVSQQGASDLNSLAVGIGMNGCRFNTSGATANQYHELHFVADAEL